MTLGNRGSLIAGIVFFSHLTNQFQLSESSIAPNAKASGTISPFPSIELAATNGG
jgi:hypothetical protein